MKKIIIVIYLILSTFVFGKNQVRYTSKLLGTSDGQIISVINGDEIHPLASVTKIMTVLLTYEAIEEGKIRLDDMVKIPDEMRQIGGSRIWTVKDDELSLEDLIKATAIHSANNAAYTLAYYVSNGDIDEFVKKMNDKAKELGMKDTIYGTPAGLPPYMTGRPMDVSTVIDTYKLSMYAIKNKQYMEIASMERASIRNGRQSFNNRNKILGEYGIYGIKTGYHSLAGCNISVGSKYNDMDVIEIVFGSETSKIRNEEAIKDLKEFYENYSNKIILRKDEFIGKVTIENSQTPELSFKASKDYKRVLKNNSYTKRKVLLDKNLKAPIKKGTKVGEIQIFENEKIIFRKELKAEVDIKKITLFQRILDFIGL